MTTAFVAEAFAAMNSHYSGQISESRVYAGGAHVAAFAVADWDPSVPSDAWPIVLHRGRRSRRALALVHDPAASPAQLRALAAALAVAGDDLSVVLPRLAAGASGREAWRTAIDHAAAVAGLIGEEVSIGGHGAGAALALGAALRAPMAIGGRLALFSPLIRRRPAPGFGAWDDPWIAGEDPLVRAEVDALLAELAAATAALGGAARRAMSARVFVARSGADAVAEAAVWPVDSPGGGFELPAALGVGAIGLVQDPQGVAPWADGPANPRFGEMAAAAAAFLAAPGAATEDPGPPAGEDRPGAPATPAAGGGEPGADPAPPVGDEDEDEATRRLIDAQTARGTDPEEIRKVARFANRARDGRS